ncbi:MAG: bifunctional (p)ppGpp synthetase/guanosine-3',5'-bis(diphosphate) 3'-pyrophosphohydrolase [Bacteroidales bacterium]|nr:bifunctional (p)ppGpp synthetase/guanosine-3',5'-bis(diphosphate) 3'-pyrophosphohydrolase [Bacteroidales bacterium]
MQSGYTKEELRKIIPYYRDIQIQLRPRTTLEERKEVRKAFSLAMVAHSGVKRAGGDPYIIHPLEVAQIVLNRMNLDSVSVICALLHDVVEDTEYTLQDMEAMFGKQVATIIDGLTKIEDVSSTVASVQTENFRKILLTLSTDPRVILIKLADRLHNMRTLEALSVEKQQKISSETMYLYAPLAHRLGFYAIKSEMEDLCMRYQDPGSFAFIEQKLRDTEQQRQQFIRDFIRPIQERMDERGIKGEIIYRVKSIYSIWQKMSKKQIPFEEVYDLFAIRIIVDVSSEHAKSECWAVYSLVTDVYRPNTERLRDWISIPKANGYQALHITVMSNPTEHNPNGRWVEVQIRSKQMDAIAENGIAAHWLYKGDAVSSDSQEGIDEWLQQVKYVLQNQQEAPSNELISKVQMNLFSKEIYVYTPKGEFHTMPLGSTVLDFAYGISEDIGSHCIGAKVNNKLVPVQYALNSGDQVEVITSTKQMVHEGWQQIAKTALAQIKISEALALQKDAKQAEGKRRLQEYFEKLEVEFDRVSVRRLKDFLGIDERVDLYEEVYNGNVNEAKVKRCFSRWSYLYKISHSVANNVRYLSRRIHYVFSMEAFVRKRMKRNPASMLLDEDMTHIHQTVAKCCNPIAGDSVIGIRKSDHEIVVHRTNCPEARQMMAKMGKNIVKAKWNKDAQNIDFLTGIRINGFDKKGLVNEVTNILYQDFKVNCRSINFETSEGLFEGSIMLYVQNLTILNELIDRLKKVDGIQGVARINSYTRHEG